MTTQGIVLTLFGQTAVGKTRTKNEDSFVISNLTNSAPIYSTATPVALEVKGRGILIAVSDGMGGAHAGEVASALVLSSLRHGLSTVQASSADVALRATVEGANQQVFDTAQATGRAGMGATLTAVLFNGIYAYVAEVGDSRAYLLRAGRLVQLTRDQSYVQTLMDAGQLTQAESETSDLKNVILQAMGVSPSVVAVLGRVAIRRHDRFLVCSDGLSGKLTNLEMASCLLDNVAPNAACAKLLETAVERGSEDDITVIWAEVDGEGAPAMTAPEHLAVGGTAVVAPL
jgi:PPM family protein phosphatase